MIPHNQFLIVGQIYKEKLEKLFGTICITNNSNNFSLNMV